MMLDIALQTNRRGDGIDLEVGRNGYLKAGRCCCSANSDAGDVSISEPGHIVLRNFCVVALLLYQQSGIAHDEQRSPSFVFIVTWWSLIKR